MNQVTLKVLGMSCKSCVSKIENKLQTIGVDGKVDFSNMALQVNFDESQVPLQIIKDAVSGLGYKVEQ